MKLVGIEFVKYEHATFILVVSTGESLCDSFLFKSKKEGL